MSDEQLAQLFAEGTAPERDAAFARRVDERIGQARSGLRLLPLAMPALMIVAFAAAVFMAMQVLHQVAVDVPSFMGVPVPLALGLLVIALTVRFPRFVGLRND